MNLIDISTLQAMSYYDLQTKFPYTSFPSDMGVMTDADLAHYGVARLFYTDQPINDFATVTMGAPELVDGVYQTTWTQELLQLEQCQQIQLTKLAQYRASIAYKDVVFNGVSVPVNSEVITILQVVISGITAIDFKGNDGWLTLTPADATALLSQIQAQVQTAFSNEKKHHDAIMALTVADDVVAYDIAQGW